MKNKPYRLAQLKYQIAARKQNGVREVIWKLNRTQEEYVTMVLHYQATPYLYRIQTRRLKNYSNAHPLLKELHHANKQEKRTIVKKLNHGQRKVLDENGIRYWAEKYRISLT